MSEIVSDAFVRSANAAWEVTGEGVRRQILGFGADLMMVRVDFECGAVGALHHHPHRQVSYVAAGSFEVTVAGARSVLSTGDCFFVEADLPHGVVAREAATLIDVFTPAREDFLARI
jgi:quercetin dioxygenase-like cupin family protein